MSLNWFSKLKQAVTKSSGKISQGLNDIFRKKVLDQEALDELEMLLLSADFGVKTTTLFLDNLKKQKFSKEITAEEIRQELTNHIKKSLEASQQDFSIKPNQLNIILVCGVNGNGKTTTIGKLAAYYKKQGKKVALAACDTFRAAAVEQLKTWAERAEVSFYSGNEKSDPASVAYKAVVSAKEENCDLLFIDTAGRLHNKQNLMEELAKIYKVIKKLDEDAPHHSLLVLDATTGQNAFMQLEEFSKIAHISGLVITKLDGTAKAGVAIGLSQQYQLPIHFIGIGEGVDDLRPFNSSDFSQSLL